MPRCLAPMVKNLPDNVGDLRDKGLIPKLGRSPGIGNSNPLKYSYLEKIHGQRSLAVTVHGMAKSWTRLSMHAHKVLYLGVSASFFNTLAHDASDWSKYTHGCLSSFLHLFLFFQFSLVQSLSHVQLFATP